MKKLIAILLLLTLSCSSIPEQTYLKQNTPVYMEYSGQIVLTNKLATGGPVTLLDRAEDDISYSKIQFPNDTNKYFVPTIYLTSDSLTFLCKNNVNTKTPSHKEFHEIPLGEFLRTFPLDERPGIKLGLVQLNLEYFQETGKVGIVDHFLIGECLTVSFQKWCKQKYGN